MRSQISTQNFYRFTLPQNLITRISLLLLTLCFFGGVWGQVPNGYLDFGTTSNGTTASTTNTGFGGVRVGAAGGGFTIQNPGQSIGTDGELTGIAPTTAAINSVGLTSAEYGTASTTFTISFELHLSGGASGTWYFFAGNGSPFGSAQNTGFSGATTFTGIRWAFGASNAITTNNRAGASWNATGLSTPFAQNTSYFVTIIGNNSSSTVNYGASDIYSVAANKYDLWINGSLAGNDLAKAELANSANINAFRFYGESSTGNVATISLDNIRWYNTCTLPPTHLVLASVPTTGTVGTNLNSFAAEARSGSSIGPVANAFIGSINIAKVNGAGSISGTTSTNATSGIATYSNIQFSSADIYTINASAAAPVINAATSGNILISSIPTITGAATTSAFTSTFGTASTAQSFSISGSNLTANLVATAPTGFEVSADGNTYGTTATYSHTGGSASGTLYIRLSSSAAIGSYNNQNIVLSSNGATSVNISTPSTGNEVTCTSGTYTGASGGNWSTGSNWCGGSVPTSASNVTIPSGVIVNLDAATTTVANLTIDGTLVVQAGKQLAVTGTLTNNGTLTLENGATFKQGTSVSGGGTYNIQQNLDNCSDDGTNLTGRFWYLGSPVTSLRENSFGNTGNLNKVWSFTNGAYTTVADGATLSPTTGYVHRRGSNASPLTFTGTNLYAQDVTLSLSNNAGTYAGWHLVSNPYTAYLDWHQVAGSNLSSNLSNTYYIRSYNSNNQDVDALISYNASSGLESNTSSLSLTSAQAQYIAPMQAIWVKVNPTTPLSATAGQLRLERAFTSHQTGNVGLKNTGIYPVLARVNLHNGAMYDQALVYMNEFMTNSSDQNDSEKMFVSGVASIYTMASGKKLVMNGLKNNKKKISVPLYLELPTSKVYQLQLSEYIMEDGLILLEDKQEGTIQDFTINDTYAFYANSGVLSNRFVLHFFMPDNGITAQGPSNNWVEEESAINEGGSILVSSNGRGKVTITQDIDATPSEKGSVMVRDAAGREIYNGQLTGSATNIELDAPSGIYFVEVELNGQVEVKKIFVQQ